MFFKDNKRKMVILDHLDLFVEKLLNRIADESDEGKKQLLHIIDNAKTKYNEPLQSCFTSWFYQYSRVRNQDINSAILGIDVIPDSYTRLQEFKSLIGKGKWNSSSFNYRLFVELIASVPGYEPLEKDILPGIILRVKELILSKIDVFMCQYETNKKIMQCREIELKNAQQIVQKKGDNILVDDELEKAKSSALRHSDKTQFFLSVPNKELFWIDSRGQSYRLDPGEVLMNLLDCHPGQLLETFHPGQKKQLKMACEKARELFLNKLLQVLVNPKDAVSEKEMSNEDLREKGMLTTFVLRGSPNDYSLCWINYSGNVKEISLASYPALNDWLNGQKCLDEDALCTLKAYLLAVDTFKPIGREDFKMHLNDCLTKKPSLMTNREVTEIKDHKEPVHRKKLDSQFFARMEQCLNSQLSKDRPSSTPVMNIGA